MPEFYIKITKKFGWTKDVLINQLEAGAFERYMANQTNFDKAVPEKYRHQAKLAVKDEYSFDFLELGEEHSEKGLERALLENVRKFLIDRKNKVFGVAMHTFLSPEAKSNWSISIVKPVWELA
ncbi:MAG: hypothetical protein NUV74_15180 [Candidatus Brocadiaceae bacterium]|nr:hypothetical protein [Candidatus Brocadiaceae bacterium]